MWPMGRRRRTGLKLVGSTMAGVMVAGLIVVGSLGALIGSPGGASSAPQGAWEGRAVPLSWQEAEARAVTRCPSIPWSVLGALGWLASRSASNSIAPPALPQWPGGPFGIDPASRSLPNPSILLYANRAVEILCPMMNSDGTLEQALVTVLGEASAVTEVNVLATSLAVAPALSATRAGALAFAALAIGLPYQWGGNGPNSYDCSGLMVASFKAVGIAIQRTAQEQHDASKLLSTSPQPGDLVFFGSSERDISHVGMVVGEQLMIDAPETGAFVRVESYGWNDLRSEGSLAPD